MHRYILTASTAVVLLAPAVASAGCPNQCEITAEPVLVEPPLSCGSIELGSASDCNCGVFVRFENPCPTTLDAVDFEFTLSCSPESAVDGRCVSVTPYESAAARILINQLGETRETLTVRDADGEHTVTVVAHVSEFLDPGVCACAAVGRRRGWLGWGTALGALGFAGLLGRGRRRAQRRRGD